LGSELLKLLPFAQKPQKAEQLDTLAQQLVRIAQAVQPTAVNEQQAVEQVRANPQLRAAFVARAVESWDEIRPAWEAEEKSRREARQFAAQMTGEGPAWRQVGYGVLVAVIALILINGIGGMFWGVLFGDAEQFSQSTRDGIVETAKNILILVVGFFFGSSASNRQKDTTIQEQARR
jgi:hypothetical protein